jgi:hypothetical protein
LSRPATWSPTAPPAVPASACWPPGGDELTRRLATLAAALLTVAAIAGSAGTAAAFPPGQGPGGPILVISNPGDPFSRYYAEILTAEGLNAFDVRDVGQVSGATLASYSVAILAPTSLNASQAASLSSWVQSGGNLIAMRPGAELAGLLGLGSDTGDLDNGYIRVNTGVGPGNGITGDTMQFHDRADRWTLAGATRVADLYSDATAATTNPAVTLRSVGTAGGQAAAFTYDLARSIVQTRQGNPEWAGQKRDGQIPPIRSDDLFFPNWVNLNKVAIPQADEQQRLLANLVTQMSADRVPMPRFWYFPRGERAVVIMTGDDHGTGGTAGQFDQFLAASAPGCSVPDWECIRSTSYVYPDTPVPEATSYQTQSFEIALHLDTDCANFTPTSLADFWAVQLPEFTASFPGVLPPRTNRTHCIAWSDWASEAKVGLANGIRLDTNYYYWPGSWVQNRPGMFTGSGIPMRFADLDGSLIDVYQATTQMTDESDMTIPIHIAALLDRALGPQGYYGAFTANMHTDQANHPGANAIVAAAIARGVPVISARQMLDWIDGRNNSSFGGLTFDGSHLRFTLNQAAGARGLEAMVPAVAPGGRLSGLTRDGTPVATASRVVKGIEYVVFAASPGAYVATYPPGGATGGGGTAAGGTGAPTPPSGEALPLGGDRLAPRLRVRPRRVRVSRRGRLSLRVSCPPGERLCRVALRVRRKGATVAQQQFDVAGGKTRRVSLRLTRGTRRRLSGSGSLPAMAVVTARDFAGNGATTRTRIRLLAPRRR